MADLFISLVSITPKLSTVSVNIKEPNVKGFTGIQGPHVQTPGK